MAQTYANSVCRGAGRVASRRIDAPPEQTGHRQLDHTSLYAQPVSVRHTYHIYVPAESNAARSTYYGSTVRLRRASRNSRPRPRNHRLLYRTVSRPRALLPFLLPAAALSGPAVLSSFVARVSISLGRPGPADFQPR